MRTLHIDTEMGWRGGENQLRLLLEGLGQQGIEAHVAVRPGSAAAMRLASIAPIVPCPLAFGFDPLAAIRLASYCKRYHIDLIDAHTAHGHALGLLVKAIIPTLKLVVHRRVDNLPRRTPFNRLKYLSSKVDRYIAISKAIKKILIGYGIAENRISVVRSAVPDTPYQDLEKNHEKSSLAEAFGLSRELVFLGNASALSPQKDYPTLLQAVRILKDQGLKFHCFIAGDGEQRYFLEQERIRLDLDHEVTFLGFIQDVPRFLSALDILAMPSKNEGLGTLLLDASLAGCAIAATEVGGIPEAVIHGQTGLLSPVGDPSALAMHLARLIQDPALRHSLSAFSRKRVAEEFSVQAMIEGNISVYRHLIKSAED